MTTSQKRKQTFLVLYRYPSHLRSFLQQVAESVILPRGELVGGEPIPSELISSESKKNAYFFDYKVTPPGQPEVRDNGFLDSLQLHVRWIATHPPSHDSFFLPDPLSRHLFLGSGSNGRRRRGPSHVDHSDPRISVRGAETRHRQNGRFLWKVC